MMVLARSWSIGLIGPYPPPYGGVPVHIQRLSEALRRASHQVKVYCQPVGAAVPGEVLRPVVHRSWKRWLLNYGLLCREDIIHHHDGWHWSPALLAMLTLGKRVVVTVHDERTPVKLSACSKVERISAHVLARSRAVRWIAVSPVVREQLLSLGIREDQIEVIPAYIPADAAAHKGAGILPPSVLSFMSVHRPVLSTYGWRVWLDEHGVDVYGFDLCVEMIRELKAHYPAVGLIILVPVIGEDERDYYASLHARCREYGIEQDVLFLTEHLQSAVPLWRVSDAFVRASNTDGDAISVREAIMAGVPVVASDAAPRPSGVQLFRSRDIPSLIVSVCEVLDHRDRYAQLSSQLGTSDFGKSVLELYGRLMRQ